MSKVKIIAEAGVNHNGDIELAKELISAAFDSGADVIKFQSFNTEELVTTKASQAPYQSKNSKIKETQYEMLKKLELNRESHFILKEECDNLGIEFFSTAFDLTSLDFLIKDLKLRTLKIPSGEITNGSLILNSALSGCDLIISTGMANLEEIKDALAIAAFGFTIKNDLNPSLTKFKKAFFSQKGKEFLKKKVSLLHCTSSYPASFEDLNLNSMETMRKKFQLPVGYSDHSLGIEASIAAVAKGAHIIEKHFTLDRKLSGPDHLASCEPPEFTNLVNSIRNIETALGDGIKEPKISELENKKVARKSIFATQNIKKGELITQEMLSIKRPEIGMNPMMIWDLIGSKAKKDYEKDEVLK